ncbi:MAG: glycosyltransferase family 2 protein [Lachnospiraceae bacterium]
MEKVSLILTTYNSEENLPKTLQSIEEQDYPNIEVVIKDGCSTDGTIELIKQYQKQSKHNVTYISEKDHGIYEAMNRGFELSSGEVVAFFNDTFTTKSAITKLMYALNSKGNIYQGVHADLVYEENGNVIRKWKMGEGCIEQGWMPAHPTLFLRRSVYEEYGLYNTTYKISSDYEFILRILKDKKIGLAYLEEVLVSMFYGGTSNGSLKNYWISTVEGYRALKYNKVRYPLKITIFRIWRVLKQFF